MLPTMLYVLFICCMCGIFVLFLSLQVFLCSTVNGYEGTGRSLSLKLIAQLRDAAVSRPQTAAGAAGAVARTFREVSLDEPIR